MTATHAPHAPHAPCVCCGGHRGQTGGHPPRCLGCLTCNPTASKHGPLHARGSHEVDAGEVGYIAWRLPGPVQQTLFDTGGRR